MGETAGEREGVAGDRLPTATAPHRRGSRGGGRAARPPRKAGLPVAQAGQDSAGVKPPRQLCCICNFFQKFFLAAQHAGRGCRAARLPRGCRTGPPRRETMGRHSGARSLASAAVPGRLSDRDPPAEPGPTHGPPTPPRCPGSPESRSAHGGSGRPRVPPSQTRSSLPCTRSQCRRRRIKVSSTFLDPVMVGYTGRTERSRSPRRVWKSHD